MKSAFTLGEKIVRSLISIVLILCFGAFGIKAAHANVRCGIATVSVGDSETTEHFCYDDGVIPTPGGGPPPGGGGDGGSDGVGHPPSLAMQKHETNCAIAYGKYSPKVGVITTFSPNWGWFIDIGKDEYRIETPTSALPPPMDGHKWTGLDGDTNYIGEPTMATTVFMGAYSSVANTINTLAHEFAHQNDVLDEDAAEAIGKAAEDAFLADSGAKCHGP